LTHGRILVAPRAQRKFVARATVGGVRRAGTGPVSGGAPAGVGAIALAAVGSTVTLKGNFAAHPLTPSTMRGTTTGSPIAATNTGTTRSFTFPIAGFYAYYCAVHGSDFSAYMNGVIWGSSHGALGFR
jgi:plastocyanin